MSPFDRSTGSGRPSDALSPETLHAMYWTMLLARRVDERAWILHRQGKIAFHISGMGHEAVQVGAAFAMNRGVDYLNPYYRDLAFVMAIGVTARDFMISLFGKAGELSSKARQMPSHWSAKHLNILSSSSPVATQVPQTAGLAWAIRYRQELGLVDWRDTSQPRVAVTCLGEGSTSQGEWHEGLNWAGVHKLPFICIVQNNNYAISVPIEHQMAVSRVATRAIAYGLHGETADGNDALAMYDAMHAAVQRAYSGLGATLIEARCYRLTPHSSDDDDRAYRPREEVEEAKRNDPIALFAQTLIDRGLMTPEQIREYDRRARSVVDEDQREAEAAPYPDEASLYQDIYAQ